MDTEKLKKMISDAFERERRDGMQVEKIESPLKYIVQAHEAHISGETPKFPVDNRSWDEVKKELLCK